MTNGNIENTTALNEWMDGVREWAAIPKHPDFSIEHCEDKGYVIIYPVVVGRDYDGEQQASLVVAAIEEQLQLQRNSQTAIIIDFSHYKKTTFIGEIKGGLLRLLKNKEVRTMVVIPDFLLSSWNTFNERDFDKAFSGKWSPTLNDALVKLQLDDAPLDN